MVSKTNVRNQAIPAHQYQRCIKHDNEKQDTVNEFLVRTVFRIVSNVF